MDFSALRNLLTVGILGFATATVSGCGLMAPQVTGWNLSRTRIEAAQAGELQQASFDESYQLPSPQLQPPPELRAAIEAGFPAVLQDGEAFEGNWGQTQPSIPEAVSQRTRQIVLPGEPIDFWAGRSKERF